MILYLYRDVGYNMLTGRIPKEFCMKKTKPSKHSTTTTTADIFRPVGRGVRTHACLCWYCRVRVRVSLDPLMRACSHTYTHTHTHTQTRAPACTYSCTRSYSHCPDSLLISFFSALAFASQKVFPKASIIHTHSLHCRARSQIRVRLRSELRAAQ